MCSPNTGKYVRRYRFTFQGQESDDEISCVKGVHLTAEFWEYDSRIARRWNIDPVIKYHESLYSTFSLNPTRFIDFLGADTVDFTMNDDGIFSINHTANAEGDDVFRYTINGETSTYVFNEGEYSDRVNALNIESTDKYTIGIYHISGEASSEGGVGFYLTPGGDASNIIGSGKRLSDGTYLIKSSPDAAKKWVMPWVTSEDNADIELRGIKWHPALTPTASTWTTGCYVLLPSYTLKNCTPKIIPNKSTESAFNFVHLLGAYNISDKRVGKYCRITSKFKESNIRQLNQKSIWNEE